MDLRQLYRLLPPQAAQLGICAPHLDDTALRDKIEQLRTAGEAVVVDLLGNATLHVELQCDRKLVLRNGVWQVVGL
jgi:ATP phosphoribosyltransferase regulatory subunit